MFVENIFIDSDKSCELVSLETYLARLRPGNWTRDETSLAVSNLPCSLNCEPYSQLACIDATLSMSFEIGTIANSGYEFAGDYEPKGCYVYLSGDFEGLTFYGTGGHSALYVEKELIGQSDVRMI